jgi:Protein of unknown function (DUF3467)
VAKDKDTEIQAGGEQATRSEAGGAQQPGAAGQQQATINIDDSHVEAHYANFCRVSSTPEELVLDLGLNPQPYATGPQTIRVSQRIILNHYTAKRLLSALSMALQRHEQAFGVLETDIRKRVRNT